MSVSPETESPPSRMRSRGCCLRLGQRATATASPAPTESFAARRVPTAPPPTTVTATIPGSDVPLAALAGAPEGLGDGPLRASGRGAPVVPQTCAQGLPLRHLVCLRLRPAPMTWRLEQKNRGFHPAGASTPGYFVSERDLVGMENDDVHSTREPSGRQEQ